MDQEEKKSREVSESVVETVHIVRPNHLNAAGRLFGGMLMQWIDEVAAIVAKRHSRMNVTTVSVDHLCFLKGAYQNNMIALVGRLVYVGRTSMDVQVESYVEELDGTRTLINRAYLTLVALDENDRPAPVPGLALVTEQEREAWEAAKRRREVRRAIH